MGKNLTNMMLNKRARNKNKVRKQAKLLYATGVRGAVSGWKGVSSECGRRGSVREVPGRTLRNGHVSVSTVTLHKREKDGYTHQKAGNHSLRRPGNFLAFFFLNIN